MRNLIDFAWLDPDPEVVRLLGLDVASYTGAARRARSYYDALRAVGVRILMVQEVDNLRALSTGYNGGIVDVRFARASSREVGHVDSAPVAYAVSDGSRWDPSYAGDVIAEYGRGVGDEEPGPFVFYGNRYAVDAACSGAARSAHAARCLNLNGGWIPRTWDFDEARDSMAQEIGGEPIPGTDMNTVYRSTFEGGGGSSTTQEAQAVDLYTTTDNAVTTYWRDAGGILVPIDPALAAVYYPAIVAGKANVFPLGGFFAALAFTAATLKARKAVGLDVPASSSSGLSADQARGIVKETLNATKLVTS